MSGTVAANTGPVIALAIIDRLDLLRTIFSEIVVPEPAHSEILEGGEFGSGVSAYLSADWIQRRPLHAPLQATPSMTQPLFAVQTIG